MAEEEILIVACDGPVEFKLHVEQSYYEYPNEYPYPRRKALYIALYYGGDEYINGINRGIEYIAKINKYDVVKWEEIAPLRQPYFPNEDVASWNPGREFVKISFNPVIRLPHRIINQKGERITYRFTTFEKLLKARYTHEL